MWVQYRYPKPIDGWYIFLFGFQNRFYHDPCKSQGTEVSKRKNVWIVSLSKFDFLMLAFGLWLWGLRSERWFHFTWKDDRSNWSWDGSIKTGSKPIDPLLTRQFPLPIPYVEPVINLRCVMFSKIKKWQWMFSIGATYAYAILCFFSSYLPMLC